MKSKGNRIVRRHARRVRFDYTKAVRDKYHRRLLKEGATLNELWGNPREVLEMLLEDGELLGRSRKRVVGLMSIYATPWRLKFPPHGDDHSGCDWITVLAQGVPAHIGTSRAGAESEGEASYSAFLPPAGTVPTDDDGQTMRAVVFVTEGASKGTARSPQQYVRPRLVLFGQEYATIPFADLHQLICDALRGAAPDSWPKCAGPTMEVSSSSRTAASGRAIAVVHEARPRRRIRGCTSALGPATDGA
jgi:hypothetical protein